MSEDPLAAARGIVLVMVIGLALWAVIVGAVIFFIP